MGMTFRVAMAVTALAIAGTAAAADVTLKSAWMRPAVEGAGATRAYVDIESNVPLTLIGASSPLAKRIEIVHAKRLDDPASEEVVTAMPVVPGKATRLAYRGDHLRLIDLAKTVGNGDRVPLTLKFRDASGGTSSASTDIVVRGLLRPQ